MQRWPEALAAARRSAAVVPFPETLGYEADAQRALGDPSGAERTVDMILAIERIGNAQHISDRLLAIYFSEHRLHTADAYAIAKHELIQRDDIYAEDTLAWAAAMDGRWDEARAQSRRALRFDTEDSRLQYHAGVIALHFGGRAQAKLRFQRALALNPQFHPVYAPDARAQLEKL
jgi:tetratricopeptide (TPR) repeat protein